MDSYACIPHSPLQHLSPCLFVLSTLTIFLMMLSLVCLPTWISVFDLLTGSLSLCWDRNHLENLFLRCLLTLETVPPTRLVNISALQVPYAPTWLSHCFPTLSICVSLKTESVIWRENKVEEIFFHSVTGKMFLIIQAFLKTGWAAFVREEAHHHQELPRSGWSNAMRGFLHCEQAGLDWVSGTISQTLVHQNQPGGLFK